VTLDDGSSHPFAVRGATGKAGIYRGEVEADGAAWVGGWIVLRGGAQRGALTGPQGVVAAPAIAAGAASQAVQAEGAGTIQVRRIFAPWVDPDPQPVARPALAR
jgi:hypothetical protein